MKNGNLLIALVVGGVVGFVIGKATTTPANDAGTVVADKGTPSPSAAPNGPTEGPNTVYAVPVGDAPVRGPADAKVTIVEFSDFQCPFCGRVEPTLKQIIQTYGKDVRIAWKNQPLPFHPHATPSAEAALAAGAQGKFWEFHDKLYSDQQHEERADFDKIAGELGLDVKRFDADLDSHKYQAQIDRDKAEANQFGARGTPTFFINGKKLVGAQPFPSFKAAIDEAIKEADAAIAKGTAPANVYAALTKNGATHALPPPSAPNNNRPAPEPAAGSTVKQVTDLADSPVRGAANAKVTIVEWSDFQCPFCGRVEPTIKQIMDTYGKDVRIVWKNQPLPFHPNAMPAATAAMAAFQQGNDKFWALHDKMFADQQAENPDNYKKWAQESGVNVSKWEAALNDPKVKAKIQADMKYGDQVGANGTPTFYIDGREVAGAMPFPVFKGIIDQELTKANALLAKGVKPADLYSKLLADNTANAPKAPAAPAMPGDDGKPVNIAIGTSPVRGNPKAPVTIITFSDFQCPFCGRAEPTVDEIMKKYGDKVKFVFKNEPLPFHQYAMSAAKAAVAAGEQGKYWQMHDLLFKNQTALTTDDLDKYAQQLGLDLTKFHADMESDKVKNVISQDQQLASSVGANGTPTFFINGRKIVGAQPVENFEKLIDDELAKKKG